MAQGSIKKRIRGGRTFYEVVVCVGIDPDTRRRLEQSRSYRTRQEARVALAAALADVDRGLAVRRTTATVRDVMLYWLDAHARHTVRPSTFALYKRLVELHIVAALGSIRVQKLTADDVQRFYSDKLSAGVGPRTVQMCHARLRQALKQATRQGLVARNVTDVVTPPRVPGREMHTWTAEEARRFLAVAHESIYGPIWMLALATGMRRGELLGLRWQDIDFAHGCLTIWQTVGVLEGAPTIHQPKSRSSQRVIPMPLLVLDALRAHQGTIAARRQALGALWQEYDLVFPTQCGTPINPNNLPRDYNRLIAKAGVPRIRIHDQRHTHVTLAIQSGANIKAVSKRVGHARTSITMDIYAHVMPEQHEEVSNKISALLFE